MKLGSLTVRCLNDPECNRRVRTHLIGSDEKERALLAKLLLLNRNNLYKISNHSPLAVRGGKYI